MRNVSKQQISSVSTSTNRFAVAVIGAIAGALIVHLPMNNELLATLLAAAAGGIGALTLDLILIHKSLRHSHKLALPRLMAGLLVGGFIGNWFRLDPNVAFEMAFETKPPATLQMLTTHGSFLGKQNDTILYIEFIADRETIDAITASRSFQQNEDITIALVKQPDWLNTWQWLFPDAVGLGSPIAQNPVQFEKPIVFHVSQKKPSVTTVWLVWDESTGQAVVRYAQIKN